MTRRDARAAGRAVSARMGELGLTQRALAEQAGVDAKTLRDLLDGKRWPQAVTRGRLEQALGWTYGQLEDLAEGRVDAPGDEPGSPEAAILADRTLTASQKEALLVQLRVLREAAGIRTEGDGGGASGVTRRGRYGT